MATGTSGRSFLAVVKRSGVVSEEELQRSLATLRERGVTLDDPEALAQALIDSGVITRWQADKMLQGKHKGFFLGPYRLLDMLGKGGMGAVYLAEHTLMRRRCAIKVLPTKNIGSRSYLERFYREAQAVAAMDHKNIVRAYDVNQAKVGDSDVHFLAMEYVEGRDLQRLVDEDGVLRYTDAAEYIRQAAEGLAHAHEVNMVHRDIKPANLLVNSRGVVKILDLGLAKFYDEAHEASLTVAHQETVLGTADYLSPEQAVDSHKTDYRADIYSLGCTFYFMLTGHPPFCEGSVANRLLQHQIKPPPPIRDDRPDAPESLLAIIEKMMAKDREQRYQSAQDVADDLTRWLAENGDESWREQNPELVRKAGESWRSDTQVSAAMVDTAELDLRADDDLDLAPLENSDEATKTESPLVAEDAPTDAASAAAKRDSSAQPKSKAQGGARQPSKSGKKPAAKAANKTPAAAELTPLEETGALTPLDNLQSLDVLSSEFASDQAGGSSQSDASVLSSGIGLSQPAARSGATVKKPAESAIPTSWIIALTAIGAIVVLAVLLLIIFGGNNSPQPRLVSNDYALPSAPEEPVPEPPVDKTEIDAGSVETEGDQQPPTAPQPESEPPSTPPAETTPQPDAEEPDAEEPDAEEPEASPPAPPTDASPEPLKKKPPQEKTKPAPTPPPAIEQPQVENSDREPAPEATPQPASLSDEEKKELLAAVTDAKIDLNESLPPWGGAVRNGVNYEISDGLKAAGIRVSESSENRLRVDLSVQAPEIKADAKVQFSLAAELFAPGPNGEPISVWSHRISNEAVLQSYVDPRSGKIALPTNLRKEVGTLFHRLTVAKKVGM
ncbi:MAG: serine/threonine protein kinase [Planctomycetes bacterium]|nr:serine/threonine protein kinase [Planctomycetota bacterium]